MRKLKHIINWTIWSLLTLYVVLIVLIHLPFVQSWLGSVVAGAVSKKLGTEVSVGRVDLGFFNRLIIDDVTIKDQRQADMIQARRMSVKIELLPLIDGRVAISSAQLFGARARFYRDSAGATPNYQFALDALSSKEKDKPSKLDLHIGSLIVRDLAMEYDQLDAPSTPGRFNPCHIKVSDVSAHVLLRNLNTDQLDLQVKRFSFREQSGLELQQLAFKMEADRDDATVSRLLLQLPHSTLSVDTIQATYLLDSLNTTLRYHLKDFNTTLALSDLAAVLPPQVPTAHSFDVSTSLSGTLNSIDCRHISITSPDDALTFHASGKYDAERWQAHIGSLAISDALLAEIHEAMPATPQLITRLGRVSLTGQASHAPMGDITVQGQVNTGIGNLALHGNIDNDMELWDAHVDTDSLNLQQLLDNPALGLLTARLDLDALHSVVNVKGEVPRIDLKGYSYSNLTVDGTYSPQAVGGKLVIDDPNLQADVEGVVNTTAEVPHIKLTGTIGKIVPKALHLSDRWDEATFSAIVDTDFTATSLTDAQGTIDLDDFIMAQGDSTSFHLDNLHIKSGYDDDRHFFHLDSDFGEAKLDGHFNWNTLHHSFASIVPMLVPEGKNTQPSRGDNDFTLTMQLTNSHWLQTLLGIQLDLDGPLSVDAQVCDSCRQIALNATVPSFSYGSANYHNAVLHLNTHDGNSQGDFSMSQLTAKGNIINMRIDAHTNDDQLISALTIETDHTGGGTINTITQLYDNDAGIREAHVRVMPSELVLKGMVWELEPCDILYSEKRLMIDQFTLHHNDEHLIIDGIASVHESDSLMIDLRGVDIASILEMVNFRSVKFGGKMTGQAYVCHAFKEPEAWADIMVDEFLFQQAPMGTLEAHALWNADEQQIDFDAAIDDGADEQTYVDGFVSPKRKDLDIGIRARGTSIGFVHSFTRSFISHIEGHAYGDVRVFGPIKKVDLSGEAAVVGQASIIPLGTTYTFHDDTVHIAPGSISFNDFHVYDRDHHEGLLNGAIHHTHLKNITFDLRAVADNLLAYDFPQMEANGTIGGTVWADGEAQMRGRPGEVVIDCDVTPAPSSVFIYNAANPDAISNQQFITWGTQQSLPVGSGAAAYAAGNTTAQGTTPSQTGSASSPTRGDIRMNLRINAVPEATLRLLMDQHTGDYITLHGDGVLRASYYNKGPFQMFGTYNVERGVYSMTIQNIIKKNFQFQPGSTIIFGGDPFQAALNLKAQHTVNGVSLSDLGLGNTFTSNSIRVNCLMNIVGTAGEPRVEFDLEMPTVNSEEEQMIRSIIASEQELNQQVVYLLGIGRFYTQGANNATTQTYGQTELAMQSILSGTVSSQINQLLSQVIKNDDWNFGANISTGNEGWHNAEYEGLFSGRMLNNRLLINGQFGYRDNATQATPSFIGDFDIQYVLTPGGSLALKAYNQTNDRYFTHSSLNTQGIGIIMKKDFNGLRDLFSRRPKKKK